MNANCKRLLSWLIVLTMVLSMVPVFDMSNFAVTTNAVIDQDNQDKMDAAAIVIADAENLENVFANAEVGATVSAICPVCGGETPVDWVPFTIEHVDGTPAGHYYLDQNFESDLTYNASTAAGQNVGILKPNGNVCFNLNGKSLTATGRKAISVVSSNVVLNIIDTAEIQGTVTGYFNANTGAAVSIQANPDAQINVYGGNYKKLTPDANATASVKNSQQSSVVSAGNGKINWYDGDIDGTLSQGGYKNKSYAAGVQVLSNNAEFNMYGGSIVNCQSGAAGGAVSVGIAAAHSKATFNMYGGNVSGNNSGNCGGNFYINGGVLNVHGGIIENGVSTGAYDGATYLLGGGNISFANGGTLNMDGGTIRGGTAKGLGGNIHIRNNTYGKINISGGQIYGGKFSANTKQAGSENIGINSSATGSTLTISGGDICGGIYTGTNITTKLEGSPNIVTSLQVEGKTESADTGLNVTNTSAISVTGLASGAEIQVTGAEGVVFTKASEDASNVAKYFTCTIAGREVVAEDNGQLKIAAKTLGEPQEGVFAPWDCVDNKAYCDACMKQGITQEPVVWTALNSGSTTSDLATGHYYLDGAITKAITRASGAVVCLQLNGNNVTVNDSYAFGNMANAGTLNIMDTEGAVVTGGPVKNAGAVCQVNNAAAEVHLYGGTYTKTAEAVQSSVFGIGANGGIIHMHNGATIDVSTANNSGWAPAISIIGATSQENGVFNMYGGTIKCGTTSAAYGNIMVGYNDVFAGGAVFNMMGGTVIGGNSTGNYGTFLVRFGGKLDVSGGQIYGGTGTGDGGNIGVISTGAYISKLDVSGGEICGEIFVNNLSEITLTENAKILKELTPDGATEPVTATKTGLYITDGAVVQINNLTENAEIYIEGIEDVTLATATGDTTGIKPYNANQVVDVENDGKVYLREPVAAVGETKYGSVEDAIAAADDSYVKLLAAEQTINLAEDDVVYVDANGYDVTVKGNGTLKAMDASNDDYTGAANWTVDDTVTVENDVINPVDGRRYIVILNEQNGNKYSAHRIELCLPTVSVKPEHAGVYYRATYKCDTTLAGRIDTYGVALSALDDVDTTLENVRDESSGVKLTAVQGFKGNMVDNTVSTTSVLVRNIYKNGITDNDARGNIKIKATPYFTVDINGNNNPYDDYQGTEALEPYYVVGNATGYRNEIQGITYANMSMYDVLERVDWSKLDDTQKGYIQAWSEWGANLPDNIG